jgi:hypothetical protein
MYAFTFSLNDKSISIYLDAPEIDRTDPSRNKAAADTDRLLTAELHCYLSAVPRPTVLWIKVSYRKQRRFLSLRFKHIIFFSYPG